MRCYVLWGKNKTKKHEDTKQVRENILQLGPPTPVTQADAAWSRDMSVQPAESFLNLQPTE